MVVPVAQQRVEGEASRSLAFSVLAISSIVLLANSFRKEATFTNDSDTVIYLAKGDIATVNAGIRLNASGGKCIIEPDSTGRIYIGPVAAIAAAAGGKVLCMTEDL